MEKRIPRPSPSCSANPARRPVRSSEPAAFSLLELLVVMAIIAIMSVVLVPAIGSMGKSQSITQAAGDIPDLLSQARSYAMANNTYVYVGFYEADGKQADSVRPQPSGTGRIFVGVAASKDGTSGYSTGGWNPGDVNKGLAGLARIRSFDGLHLKNVVDQTKMDSGDHRMDLAEDDAVTTFSGTDMGVGSGSNPVAKFSKVVQFSPSGAANMVQSFTSSGNTIPSYIQLGFVSARGGTEESNNKNLFGVQIDGPSGAIRTFRPGQP